MTDPAADPRFPGRIARGITPDEYDTIRATRLTHVGAEEKLFVPHSAADEEEQLAVVFGTMTDDCVYEIKQTGERWQGQTAARQFYQRFLAALSGMKWVPRTGFINPAADGDHGEDRRDRAARRRPRLPDGQRLRCRRPIMKRVLGTTRRSQDEFVVGTCCVINGRRPLDSSMQEPDNPRADPYCVRAHDHPPVKVTRCSPPCVSGTSRFCGSPG